MYHIEAWRAVVVEWVVVYTFLNEATKGSGSEHTEARYALIRPRGCSRLPSPPRSPTALSHRTASYCTPHPVFPAKHLALVHALLAQVVYAVPVSRMVRAEEALDLQWASSKRNGGWVGG